MSTSFTCWKCAVKLHNIILPMSRREECAQCAADLHVCKMCEFYQSNSRCDEDRAEHISDTERANFCDYFKPSEQVNLQKKQQSSAAAKAKLAALFGDEVPEVDNQDESLTPAELAEKKLREMLG